jgi:hypothetical protein
MFGKEKAQADDDNGSINPPPQSSSSAPETSDQPSILDTARQTLRRPVARSHEALGRSSVRIRRAPSSSSINTVNSSNSPSVNAGLQDIPEEAAGRRRSSSEPQRPSWHAAPDAGDRLSRMATVDEMPTITEGSSHASGNRGSLRAPRGMVNHLSPHLAPHVESGNTEALDQFATHVEPHTGGLEPPRNGIFRRLSNAARRVPGVSSRASQSDANSINPAYDDDDEYDSQMVDLLDVIGMHYHPLTGNTRNPLT